MSKPSPAPVTIIRPAPALVAIATAVCRAAAVYAAAPMGVSLDAKVHAALARLDAKASTLFRNKADKNDKGQRALALIKTALGRKPKGLPADVLKSGSLKADTAASCAVREWAVLEGAKGILESMV